MEALGKENQCMICWRRKVMAVQKWTTKLGWNHLYTFSENVIVSLVIQITETFWWLLVPTYLSYILKKNNWLIKNSSWFCPRLVAHFWDPLFFTGFFLLCCRWGLGVKEWSTLVHMRSVMRCLGIYKKGVCVLCVYLCVLWALRRNFHLKSQLLTLFLVLLVQPLSMLIIIYGFSLC